MNPFRSAWLAYETCNRYVNRVAWAEQPPCGETGIPPSLVSRHRQKCKVCRLIFYPGQSA